MATDLSDENILVIVMLEQPDLIAEMQTQHQPDRPSGVQHCRACPGVTQGRAVWPCGIRQAANRAETLLRLHTTAARGRERLEREGGPLELDGRDSLSGPPAPYPRPVRLRST